MIADAPCDPYQSMNERGEQFFEGENVYKSSFRYLSSSIVQECLHAQFTKFSQPHFHVFLFTFQSQPGESP